MVVKTPDLIIENIGLLATPKGIAPLCGTKQGQIDMIKGAYVALKDGTIIEVGSGDPAASLTIEDNTKVLDAGGCLVTPGLVDAHTHLVFGGWRQKEMSLKLKGMSYLDILKQGGGILNTVRTTKEASEEQLVENGKKSLDRMLAYGTTTCEAKSGYGLELDTEMKQLRAINELERIHPMDIAATFLGAHAVPQEYKENKKEFVKKLTEEMIPKVAEEKMAQFCDVFCEDSVFDIDESREILECAKRYGMKPKIHADEIVPLGGAKLAGEVGAISAEHLIMATDEGLKAMAEAGTIACVLPGTSMYLDKPFARAKTMIEMGIPVAIASDFNPGSSPTESLQLPMNLACIRYKMTPEEVLSAVTLNAAAAIDMASTVGSVEIGKQGDLVIWDSPDLDFIFYHYGVNLVKNVIKKGEIVV